jgi:hypothetical protein
MTRDGDIHSDIFVRLAPDIARAILEAVGAEQDERGRWLFPDDFTTWDATEASQYAVEALPTIVFDGLAG